MCSVQIIVPKTIQFLTELTILHTLGITVPDVYEACERFKKLGCNLTKTPNSGGMKGLAFMKDPDGYLVEILPQGEMITKPIDCDGIAVDGGEGYKDNSKK